MTPSGIEPLDLPACDVMPQPTAPPRAPGNATTGTLFYLNNIVRSPNLSHSLTAHKHAATAARNNKLYWSHKMRELQIHELQSFTVF